MMNKIQSLRRSCFDYVRQFLVFGEFRGGTLIGTDCTGNKYFEITDKKLMFPCKNICLSTVYFTLMLLKFVIDMSNMLRDGIRTPVRFRLNGRMMLMI